MREVFTDEAAYVDLKVLNRTSISKEQTRGKIISPFGIYSTHNSGAIPVKEDSLFGEILLDVLKNNYSEWVPLDAGPSVVRRIRRVIHEITLPDLLVTKVVRIVGTDLRSRLYQTVSRNGITDWKIRRKPIFGPADGDSNDHGGEDPRLYCLRNSDTILMTVVRHYRKASSEFVYRTDLMKAVDLREFRLEFVSTIGTEGNKDTSLFEPDSDGIAAICGPEKDGKRYIAYSVSQNMVDWLWGQDLKTIWEPGSELWNCDGIGGNGHPIWISPREKLPDGGWLLFCHGRQNREYHISAMILHPTKPWIVLYRLPAWFLGPEAGYFLGIGGVPGVVFTCSEIPIWERDTILLYANIADRKETIYSLTLSKLIDLTLQYPVKYY